MPTTIVRFDVCGGFKYIWIPAKMMAGRRTTDTAIHAFFMRLSGVLYFLKNSAFPMRRETRKAEVTDIISRSKKRSDHKLSEKEKLITASTTPYPKRSAVSIAIGEKITSKHAKITEKGPFPQSTDLMKSYVKWQEGKI
jgi:hypothetical protein